jgi:hypothetical protein
MDLSVCEALASSLEISHLNPFRRLLLALETAIKIMWLVFELVQVECELVLLTILARLLRFFANAFDIEGKLVLLC